MFLTRSAIGQRRPHRQSSRGVDLFGRAPGCGSPESTGGLNNGRIFPALEEPRRRAASSDSQSDGNATLTQTEVDAEVHPPGPDFGRPAGDSHRGRRLLQFVAAEVARQAKSRALAAAVRRPEIRQWRGRSPLPQRATSSCSSSIKPALLIPSESRSDGWCFVNAAARGGQSPEPGLDRSSLS